jgi:hypothetical protein
MQTFLSSCNDTVYMDSLLIFTLEGDHWPALQTGCFTKAKLPRGELTRRLVGPQHCLVMSDKIQDDKKVFVRLMIIIQKVTSNVQSVPRQSPDIY